MITNRAISRWVLGCVGVCLLGATASSQTRNIPLSEFKATALDDMKPTGNGNQVVLFGDPNKPGLYAVQITFKAGSGSRPHYHDQDRLVTVVKGTWYVHLGPESETYAPEKMTAMKAGSFVYHPAFGYHYDGAKEEDAVVRIIGMGPVKTVNLQPRQ